MPPHDVPPRFILQKAPLFLAAIPFVIGILLADIVAGGASPETAENPFDKTTHWLLLISALLLTGSFLFNLLFPFRRLKRLRNLHLLSYFLLLSSMGSVVMSLSHLKREPSWPDESTAWRAFVTDVRQTDKTLRLRVRLISRAEGQWWINNDHTAAYTADHAGGTTGQQAMISVMRDTLNPEPVCPGDAILFYGKIERPRHRGRTSAFDYGKWLRRQGITGEAFVFTHWKKLPTQTAQRLLQRQPLTERLTIRFLQWRNLLLAQFDAFPMNADDRAVLSSLTLGSRYHLSSTLRHTYATVGGSHVLALSGLHLGILVMFLLLLLRPLRRRGIACLLSLILIWSFVFLTGMSTSLMRAAVMYTVLALLILQNRAANALNALGIAAMVLLILSPQALFDVGFQMSFLAVLSILLLNPFYARIRPEQKLWRLLADFVFIAAAAQIGTAPLVAYTFNLLPVTVLLTNFVVVPCAYVLLGGTLGYFLFLGLPPVRDLLMLGLTGTVHLMNGGLTAISRLPHAALTVYPSLFQTLLFYLLILAALLFFLRPRLRTAAACLAILCLLFATDVYNRKTDSPAPTESSSRPTTLSRAGTKMSVRHLSNKDSRPTGRRPDPTGSPFRAATGNPPQSPFS